jgi:hypothetical protein
MTFAGFLTFADRPKEGVREALAALGRLGVAVKLITGDARLVAQYVAASVGMRSASVLTGRELDALHGEALWRAAEQTDLFVEVDPNQKERIILALEKTKHVVGFRGDGVNDAPAMHAADASHVRDSVSAARIGARVRAASGRCARLAHGYHRPLRDRCRARQAALLRFASARSRRGGVMRPAERSPVATLVECRLGAVCNQDPGLLRVIHERGPRLLERCRRRRAS